MPRLIQKQRKPPVWSLREYYQRRNKILIIRETGGLGDILMHRMIFEDLKLLMPDAKVHFALPTKYHAVVKKPDEIDENGKVIKKYPPDHPFIDKVLDSATVDPLEYVCYFNTTSACCRHEMRMSPYSGMHRSDIWANHCGIPLTRHNMHINLEDEYKEFGRQKLKQLTKDTKAPTVAICPITAMVVKNFTDSQMQGVVKGLRTMGFFPFGLHTKPIPAMKEIDCPVMYGLPIRQWMGMIEAADYVISADSAGFHYAGGIGKPLVGVFTFADGKTYGKHYDFVLVQKHRDNGDWDCGPCYAWPSCPKTKAVPKPCLTCLTVPMILQGAKEMFDKHPHSSS